MASKTIEFEVNGASRGRVFAAACRAIEDAGWFLTQNDPSRGRLGFSTGMPSGSTPGTGATIDLFASSPADTRVVVSAMPNASNIGREFYRLLTVAMAATPEPDPDRATTEAGSARASTTARRSGTARQSGEATTIDLSPVGFWLAVAGSVAAAIAVFLPEADSNSFARVAHNTLIQNGDGWVFLGCAAAAVVDVYRAWKGSKRTFGPVITGGIALAFAIYLGTSSSALKLCSLDTSFSSLCEKANPGIGIYLAGLGGALMVVGGLHIRNAKGHIPHPEAATTTVNGVSAPLDADQLATLARLHADGALTDDEFTAAKIKLLAE